VVNLVVGGLSQVAFGVSELLELGTLLVGDFEPVACGLELGTVDGDLGLHRLHFNCVALDGCDQFGLGGTFGCDQLGLGGTFGPYFR
jgi:hypothetical protein